MRRPPHRRLTPNAESALACDPALVWDRQALGQQLGTKDRIDVAEGQARGLAGDTDADQVPQYAGEGGAGQVLRSGDGTWAVRWPAVAVRV
jgi:hypothetical protein